MSHCHLDERDRVEAAAMKMNCEQALTIEGCDVLAPKNSQHDAWTLALR